MSGVSDDSEVISYLPEYIVSQVTAAQSPVGVVKAVVA